MEKEITSLQIRLSPNRFVTMCRCVKNDFLCWYDYCREGPDEDNTEALDRMEEDIDLLEGLLPCLRSQSTDEAIQLTLADFRRKLAEVC